MAENKIELKSVSELLGMKFYIPNYQRGYRWTKQQVKDLLNDVNEFIQNKNSDFYSLQPLVVKKRWPDKALEQIKEKTSIEEIENYINNCEWEVIDGQQRLTTIYIILYYLDSTSPYNIDFQTRKELKISDFLEVLKGYFKSYDIKKEFADLNNNEGKEKNLVFDNVFDNIISKAFADLIKDNNCYDKIDFYHMFTSYSTIKHWFEVEYNDDEQVKKEIKSHLLKNVKFIWYESVDEEPTKVFTRLNIGKIKLTNSELIKALMLNRSNFKDESSRHIQLRQQEIASEWDHIEYTLQNDEFWLFLHENDYSKPTRIDFIFDLICDKNPFEIDKTNIGSDDYKTFRYFYQYFHSKDTNTEERLIKECWEEVKKYYQTSQEWFNDLSLYHYIGYLRCPVKDKIKIEKLVDQWKGGKDQFVLFLKSKISESLSVCKDLDKQYEVDRCPKTLCKPILLLHNIQTVINQNKELESKKEYGLPVFYKFPFHLYKKEVWNVEHIDSNTPNELSDKNDQKEWLKCSLLDDGLDNELIEQIKSFLKEEDNCPSFDDLSKKIEIKSDMNDEEKNKIWNFVLLDENTNKGYGNAIFPAKRRCIIGKDQGKIFVLNDNMKVEEGKGAIAFVPPVTKNVFLKYYNTSIDNLKCWNTTDAKSYKDNIIDTLNEFGVIDNQNTDEHGNK